MPFQGASFNIPIRVTFLEGYPARAPIVQVIPTADMVVSPNEYVRADGTVVSQMVQNWTPACNCDVLIKDLKAAFAYKMPVFAKPTNRPAGQMPPADVRNGRGSLKGQQEKEAEARAKEESERKVLGCLKVNLQSAWEKVRRDLEELDRERKELVSSREAAVQAKLQLETQLVPPTQSKQTTSLEETRRSKAALLQWTQQNPSTEAASLPLESLLPVSNRYSHQLLASLAREAALEEAAGAVLDLHSSRKCSTEDMIRSLKQLYKQQFLESKVRDKAAAAIRQLIGR